MIVFNNQKIEASTNNTQFEISQQCEKFTFYKKDKKFRNGLHKIFGQIIKSVNPQKMKFSIKDFFSNCV